MKKISQPYKPNEGKLIFPESIDYRHTGKSSIWGPGDRVTLRLLNHTPITGKWLNLAAGDGRYNLLLLKRANRVIASDIDQGALNKLYHSTPKRYRHKLQIKTFDISKRFPLKTKSLNGIFCAGTIHFFPPMAVKRILLEIDRVLSPKGKLILDFAANIKRILPNGQDYFRRSEPNYTLDGAKKLLIKSLNNYQVKIIESRVPEENIKIDSLQYKFSCRFILLLAKKA